MSLPGFARFLLQLKYRWFTEPLIYSCKYWLHNNTHTYNTDVNRWSGNLFNNTILLKVYVSQSSKHRTRIWRIAGLVWGWIQIKAHIVSICKNIYPFVLRICWYHEHVQFWQRFTFTFQYYKRDRKDLPISVHFLTSLIKLIELHFYI